MNKKALTMIGVSIATAFIISAIYFFMTKEQMPVSQKPETTENKDLIENVIPTEAEESEILHSADGSIDTSNWKTLESVEYGFTVNYPKGWRINPGGKNIGTNTKKQIDLTSPNGNDIIFNVYHVDIANGQPYKKIPFDDQLPELIDNQEVIDKYGETFRYFRGVYSMGLEGDELARDLPSRAERTKEDFYDENHIDIYIKDPLHQKEDLATMKEILKSFQR